MLVLTECKQETGTIYIISCTKTNSYIIMPRMYDDNELQPITIKL